MLYCCFYVISVNSQFQNSFYCFRKIEGIGLSSQSFKRQIREKFKDCWKQKFKRIINQTCLHMNIIVFILNGCFNFIWIEGLRLDNNDLVSLLLNHDIKFSVLSDFKIIKNLSISQKISDLKCNLSFDLMRF